MAAKRKTLWLPAVLLVLCASSAFASIPKPDISLQPGYEEKLELFTDETPAEIAWPVIDVATFAWLDEVSHVEIDLANEEPLIREVELFVTNEDPSLFAVKEKLASGVLGNAAENNVSSISELVEKMGWGEDIHGYPFVEPANGKVYARARWYDPHTGTFMSPDPMGYQDSSNMYAFCGGDPVNCSDPRGEAGLKEWWNRNIDVLDEEGWKEFRGFLSGSVGALPVVGEITDALQAATGYDIIAGEKLKTWERGVAAASILVPLGGARVMRKAAGAVIDGASDATTAAARTADDVAAAAPSPPLPKSAKTSPSTLHTRGRTPEESIVLSADEMQATLKSVRRHVDKLNQRRVGRSGAAFQDAVAAGRYDHAGSIAHNRMFKRLDSRKFETLEGNEVFINRSRIYPPPAAAGGKYKYRLPDVQYGNRGTAEYRVWDFKGIRPTAQFPDPTGQFRDIFDWTGVHATPLYYHWWWR
jgi:RHS repeat-associated protein